MATASDLLSTVETFAKSGIDAGTAASMLTLVAKGVMAVDATIKPTFATDLVAAFTDLKASYAAVQLIVADVKG